ncbi:hypothetical protein AVEN_163743-1 [Araneus ventricosus]|uniref:Uncharacterized protein n=1 Tax=Araneus ventricosus TaxID=182803 RepID=A0A4Y2MXG9_ARAVE|nr:hypothetical protein AVEN_163743-1 [Araneus ventricosus]
MGKTNSDFDRKFSSSLLIQSNKLETVIITDSCEANILKELEKSSFNRFPKNVENDKEGRFEVKIPWIRSVDELPTHKDVAGEKLISSNRELLKNNQFECYDYVFEKWKNVGVKEEFCEGPGHYLPHRRVFNSYPTVGGSDLCKSENIHVEKPWKHMQLKTSSDEVIRPVRRIYSLDIRYADEECPSSERTLTTRSGRTVKVPSRFMST